MELGYEIFPVGVTRLRIKDYYRMTSTLNYSYLKTLSRTKITVAYNHSQNN
jgi:hypothetical protein